MCQHQNADHKAKQQQHKVYVFGIIARLEDFFNYL
jgi:hypothetical protein